MKFIQLEHRKNYVILPLYELIDKFRFFPPIIDHGHAKQNIIVSYIV